MALRSARAKNEESFEIDYPYASALAPGVALAAIREIAAAVRASELVPAP